VSSDGGSGKILNARARLDAWRELGADRNDPVRFHLLDALDRRAAAYAGPARERLDQRLAELLLAYEAGLDQTAAQDSNQGVLADPVNANLDGAVDAADPDLLGPDAPGRPDSAEPALLSVASGASAASPLAQLIRYMAHPAAEGDEAVRDGLGLRAAYPEMPLLDDFRAIWAGVSADRQVRQSQEQVHKNAGPLNSNQLVHRALSLMREMSPGYLQQFLSYTDALMWMEQMTAAAAPAAKETPRAGAAKKSTRGKARKESKESKDSAGG